MRTLYIECSMGVAGDMLASALLELTDNADCIIEKLNSVGIPDVKFIKEDSVKCGIKGTHIKVLVHEKEEYEHHNSHSSLRNVQDIISSLKTSDGIKENALSVYRIIAEAESKVHGVPVTDIHFHEVGTLDAIADIVSVCLIIDELSPDEILSSPVNTGSGQVKCAHGVLPVPAPATASILNGIPTYSNGIDSELCTPTGAALLKYFAKKFCDRPLMKTEKIGYGMGNKSFDTANCVRVFLGERESRGAFITELSFNVDDMTGEEIGFLTEMLIENGAREVFSVPVGMKKSRPGTLVSVLCDEEKKEEILSVIFKHSATIGVREALKKRYTLSRKIETVHTPYGDIRKKISSGFGAEKSKYEYDDLAEIAKNNSITLKEVRHIAEEYDT